MLRHSDALILMGATLFATASLCAGERPPQYVVVDLTPGVGNFGVAYAVNDLSQVTGESFTGCVTRWDHVDAGWVATDAAPAACDIGGFSIPSAITSGGVITGSTYPNVISLVAWVAGLDTFTILPTATSNAGALDSNELGQVVGLDGGQVFIWENGAMTYLGPGIAYAINDQSVIAGGTGKAATLWQIIDGAWEPLELGTLGGPSMAVDLNNRLQVTGDFEVAESGASHAFLWEDGVMTDLGTLGGAYSVAEAISDSGDVVGWSEPSSTQLSHPFLWHDGVMHDLNELAVDSPLELVYAFGINTQGQIVGWGTQPGLASHAFIATPIVEGDLNLDALVDGADLGLLLLAWGPCPRGGSCATDLNGDGVVNGSDLGTLLLNWTG